MEPKEHSTSAFVAGRRRRLKSAALFALGAVLTSAVGCRRRPAGQDDVVPGLRYDPAVYSDINPTWSHDGRRIAFLRSTTDRRLKLYVANEDLERPLSQLPQPILRPDRPYAPNLRSFASPNSLAWSPNDREIAFENIEWFTFEDGERLPGTGLWSLDTYGRKLTPLALHPQHYRNLYYYYHSPQWSPDRRYLVFVGEGINGQHAVFVRPLAAMAPRQVVPRFDGYADSDWPTWRPQQIGGVSRLRAAQALMFRQGIDHPLAGSDTETLRQIAPGRPGEATREIWRIRDRDYARTLFPHHADIAVSPHISHISWSIDGRWLAFALTPDANAYDRYEIWTIRADGRGAQCISPRNGRGYFAPVWVDARTIGALSVRGSLFDVMSIDVPTHRARILGTIPSADCDWSPDRSRIAYALPGGTAEAPHAATTLRLFNTHVGRSRIETAARP